MVPRLGVALSRSTVFQTRSPLNAAWTVSGGSFVGITPLFRVAEAVSEELCAHSEAALAALDPIFLQELLEPIQMHSLEPMLSLVCSQFPAAPQES